MDFSSKHVNDLISEDDSKEHARHVSYPFASSSTQSDADLASSNRKFNEFSQNQLNIVRLTLQIFI